MSRTIFIFAGVFSASSLLLVDSAVKGTALLMAATALVIILRRDSAAIRHLAWLLTMVALAAVPVLSAMLPAWRVLPEWASIPPATAVMAASAPSLARPEAGAANVAPNAEPDEVEASSSSVHQPPAALPDSRPALVTLDAEPASAVWSWNWLSALPLIWAIGFCVLILRLLAARWLLWNTERKGRVLWSSRHPATETHDPIITALEAASLQLGMCRPVTLLVHPDKTIPVVWGIFRSRLLLPAAAQNWSAEQLRSVLLHELAHIKRCDPMAQLLMQIACALHWFNPLVWFAAWRIGVECERACDDLVLASGVRPSAYAGHLLDVVTSLAPARWTQSCGLAMARKSSLEGRLVAVLSEGRNRRGVSVALAALALVIAVGIAVPIAMLRAADERPGAPMEQEPQKSKGGAKLNPETEKRLRWGEPVNGLRAALTIRITSGEPKAGDKPDLYLVVQNVSKAPIRLTDADTPPNVNLRVLYLKIDGQIKWGLGAREPALGDLMLEPREVMFLPMFSLEPMIARDSKEFDGHTLGSYFAKSMLEDARQTLFAQMEIEKAPVGAWTGKLVTGETSGAAAAGNLEPKNKEAKALFKTWQDHARKNGNIPGGLVDRLGDKVKEFIRYNTGDKSGEPYAKKMALLVPRFDAGRAASRDWTPAEVVPLLDAVAAVTPVPLDTTMNEIAARTFKTGAPLPRELANAPWGEALPNGLRMAWLLEPRAAEHRLNTPLKSRILIHNAGKVAVVFRTRAWHQGSHKATDANGADIKVESVFWTTIGRLTAFRLAPGEFAELNATGIGVGANKNSEDWQNTRVGSWIEAKAGDEVTVTTGAVPLYDWNEDTTVLDGEPRWWLDFITARLQRTLPIPADKDERERLLDRAVRDLFGTAPTAEEIAAFVADRESTALDSLAKRLFHRPDLLAWAGPLTSAPTKFRVLAADPDAAKKPRTASNPGSYTLSANASLAVSRRLDGERIVNEASIRFSSPDPRKPAPEKPYELKLPDGYGTWAAAWVRGGSVLWVTQKGNVRSCDFSNPAQVKETMFEEPANLARVPQPILNALRAALPAASQPAAQAPKKQSQ